MRRGVQWEVPLGPVYDHIRAEEGYASCARTGHPYLSPGEGHPSLGFPCTLPHTVACPSRSRSIGLDQSIGMEADWHDQGGRGWIAYLLPLGLAEISLQLRRDQGLRAGALVPGSLDCREGAATYGGSCR